MSKEKVKDVSDMISDFVNSKDQFLHEEIIARIKRESFGIIDEEIGENSIEDAVANTVSNPYLEELTQKEGQIKKLEEQLTQLKKQNTQKENNEPIIPVSNNLENINFKPINTDDLRIEFLNFTSAHIQQFNTRIKKTEELIEQLAQKTQSLPIKDTKSNYPKWLLWLNVFTLATISLYFILKMFSPAHANNETSLSKIEKKHSIETMVSSTQAIQTTNEQSANTPPENKNSSPTENTIASSTNTKEEKLPFNTNNEIKENTINNLTDATPTTNIPKSITPTTQPNTKNQIEEKTNTSLQTKSIEKEKNQKNKLTNTKQNDFAKQKETKIPNNKSTINEIKNIAKRVPTTFSNNTETTQNQIASKSIKSSSQNEATAINTVKPNSVTPKSNDNKTSVKQKVYFGED